jgi:3-hydroxy-3-methylglutaryl CoA synthase
MTLYSPDTSLPSTILGSTNKVTSTLKDANGGRVILGKAAASTLNSIAPALTGNTVSSSIPLLLIHMIENNCFNSDKKIILIGFGVGYSWGACVVNFNGAI